MTEARGERQAIIISVGRYAAGSGLTGYDSVDATARRLTELLEQDGRPLWDRVVRVVDPESPHGIIDAIARGMQAARGGGRLLVHYIGHGEVLTVGSGETYKYTGLALSTSRTRAPWSFLALDVVQEEMRVHHDCARALVLDCCNSAGAGALGVPALEFGEPDGRRDPFGARPAADAWSARDPNTCVLTAVSHGSRSQLTGAIRPDGLTEFSGLMIDVLESGIPGAGAVLNIRDLYQGMKDSPQGKDVRPGLIQRGPYPLDVFPNRAAPDHAARGGPPDTREQDRRLAAADPRELVAAWMRRQGPLADIDTDRVVACVQRRMAGAPAAHVAHIVHLTHGYEEGTVEWLRDTLSRPLLGRDAWDNGTVMRALAAHGCPDCLLFGRWIGDSVVKHGGPQDALRLMAGRRHDPLSPGPGGGGTP
ncbi:hypothetical protein POF50_026420 [Streptomyces sp. SL13]|uniref:Caspase family protein n=1 Tax=Streptantibioticus silvisoli TaxID=2705255 RepID=A0AA90K086_9ACTN|nr:hypothetical protein [Streptantibioticus silvisoli]MDI5972836.1 hypothetical protein [Streptantibioticus silvisoli]